MNDGHLLKSRDRGVFRSTDLGKTWLKIADYPKGHFGEPRVIVGDMNVFGRVFVGTDGNGFIYGEIESRSSAERSGLK